MHNFLNQNTKNTRSIAYQRNQLANLITHLVKKKKNPADNLKGIKADEIQLLRRIRKEKKPE